MVRSMTGFGHAGAQSAEHRLAVEVRTVNHRFLDVAVRLPREYGALEDRIRRAVTQHIERGRVDVTVRIDRLTSPVRGVHVDTHLAHAYYEALKELRRVLRLPGSIDVDMLLDLPDVLRVEQAEEDLDALWAALAPLLDAALRQVVAMREAEGAALAQDLAQRAARVEAQVEAVAGRAPEVVQAYRRRLEGRLAEWGDLAVDPQRVAAEVALMAERSDISEECVRLRSHCRQFRELLAQGGPVGRRLDFLLQEMHREINTIGAKAADLDIAGRVVEVKAELEKMREQVQNVE
ncbi:YicC/YloC family endoribonuclease [Thermaerobacter subterraneus]|uniref:TIGR00255 family protein n=1 Tax=Thermaerobacter subterraneus DSM 13965 TaxID=867903 RepID=K6NXZ8_9FIRM|nr:YicC/YloC family endoribonuclease [Thermaerobacter subterraneus]EKP93745.1 TIGR00255 family protein [Thermaerobacter subterraneus DSM 13965]QIA26884.1 YicC family protein [Thermaerobacter sp. PB12/4term]